MQFEVLHELFNHPVRIRTRRGGNGDVVDEHRHNDADRTPGVDKE